MISWMQKHNKYLVWTIWVATIAFIGAGFVGWGSYDLGAKAGNVAKVGDIEIKQTKLNMVYSNIYAQYNQMMQGKLDDKKAQEMGLIKKAFSTLETQAKILNFAKDTGIVVSDKELLKSLEAIKSFQTDGKFDRTIYTNYLKSQRLKPKDFEATLKDELIVTKTLSLLTPDSLPLEEETVGAAMNIADKIAYKVLTTNDVTYNSDATKVKAFWEEQKDNYMTTKEYTLSLLWTSTDNAEINDQELKNFYDANSFNYTNAEGKQLNFEEAKLNASKDLKLKKVKKSAQKAYIAFKKGLLESTESITLPVGDLKLTPAIWDEVLLKSKGDIVKPKIVGDRYVTVRIDEIIEPKVMNFAQAQEIVTKEYDNQAKITSLTALAEETLKGITSTNAEVSDFLTLTQHDNLKSLNSQESLQFVQKLFTSNKEKGIITVLDKVIVYNIIEQKLLSIDENQTESVKQTVNEMKKKTFESNFLKYLDSKYPTNTYQGGLIN